MKRAMFPLSALMLLVACDGGAPQQETADITVPEGNTQARLETMPEAQRNAVFIRAIRDAGRECQHVQSSAESGEINNAPAWTATCDNGVQWTIAIGRDGVAQVMSTAELQALAGQTGKQAQ